MIGIKKEICHQAHQHNEHVQAVCHLSQLYQRLLGRGVGEGAHCQRLPGGEPHLSGPPHQVRLWHEFKMVPWFNQRETSSKVKESIQPKLIVDGKIKLTSMTAFGLVTSLLK